MTTRDYVSTRGCKSLCENSPRRGAAAELLLIIVVTAAAFAALVAWVGADLADIIEAPAAAGDAQDSPPEFPVYSMAVSADETRAVLHGHRQPGMLVTAAGDVIEPLFLPEWGVASLTLAPAGDRFAAGLDDGSLLIGELGASREVRRFEPKHSGTVRTVGFSQDGRLVASADDTDGLAPSVRVWDTDSGQLAARLDTPGTAVDRLQFAADASRLVLGCTDGTVRLWSPVDGRVRVLGRHAGLVMVVDISADGRLIVSGSSDATIRAWNAESGAEVRRIDVGRAIVAAIALACDGSTVAAGCSNGDILLFQVGSSQPPSILGRHDRFVSHLQFSPDGQRLYSASHDGTFRVWSVPASDLPDRAPGQGRRRGQ